MRMTIPQSRRFEGGFLMPPSPSVGVLADWTPPTNACSKNPYSWRSLLPQGPQFPLCSCDFNSSYSLDTFWLLWWEVCIVLESQNWPKYPRTQSSSSLHSGRATRGGTCCSRCTEWPEGRPGWTLLSAQWDDGGWTAAAYWCEGPWEGAGLRSRWKEESEGRVGQRA